MEIIPQIIIFLFAPVLLAFGQKENPSEFTEKCPEEPKVYPDDELKFDGECAKIPSVKDFDYQKFEGSWYEIKRFPNGLVGEQCAVARFTSLAYNNYNITYLSRDIDRKKTFKRHLVIDKEIINSPDIRYDVYFKCKKDSFQHLILDTDYTNYSVVWGCYHKPKQNENLQRLFVYSRTKSLDEENLKKIKELLDKHHISYDELKDVEQKLEECGDVETEPFIWDGCPNEICKDLECVVP